MEMLGKLAERIWQSAWGFQALLLILGASSALMLFYFDAQTLSVASVQQLWQSAFAPTRPFDFWLQPLNANPTAAVLLMGALSCLTLCLFCQLALWLGLSRQSALVLFLLMNFNPEYNDVRLSVDVFQLIIPLWLLGFGAIIRHYASAPRRALAQFLLAWLVGVWLEPATMLLGLSFPFAFALLDGKLSFKKLRFWLYFGLACGILFCLLPHTNLFLQQLWQDWWREIPPPVVQLGEKRIAHLSALERYGLGLMLVWLNVLRCAGLLMVGLVCLSWWVRFRVKIASVLVWRVQGFLWLGLGFSTLVMAFLWVEQGRVLGDLAYMPLVMMLLLLASGAIFYALERVRALSDIAKLVWFWTGISYALASMISFGPTAGHLRTAGLWAQSQSALSSAPIYSNSAQILFYARQSPLDDNPQRVGSLADWFDRATHQSALPPHAVLLYSHHRRAPLPPELAYFERLAEFKNAHGDRVFALRYQP